MNGLMVGCELRLAADSELRFTASGHALLEFRGAVDAGTKEAPATEWVKCVVWREEAERLSEEGRLTRGSRAYVEGRLKVDRWTGSDGEAKWGLSINATLVQPMGVPQGKTKDQGQPRRREQMAGFPGRQRDDDGDQSLPF